MTTEPPTRNAKRRIRSLRTVVRSLVTLAALVLAGCGQGDEPPSSSVVSGDSVRGNRYCEVLVANVEPGGVVADVWGTQGLNDCPAAAWEKLDATALKAELGATAVLLNGPRYWVIDSATGELPDVPTRLYGELEMRLLATVALPPGTTGTPYLERTVKRHAEFEFHAGSEIYELLAPNGSIYVMQSFAQIVDATLGATDLPKLGERLAVPMGWSYRVRTLEAPLVVTTPGEATVLQDELANSYSRYVQGG